MIIQPIRLCTLVNLTYYARLVLKGERYGMNDCLVHDKEMPLIEFFLNPKPGEIMKESGYFVSRYYIDTILAIKDRGLLLDTAFPTLSWEDIKAVQAFIVSAVPSNLIHQQNETL